MLTPSLALLGRSFRVDSRQMRPHLFRLAFLGLMFLALWFAHMTSLFVGAPGLNLFTWIVWQSFIYITLAAVGFFATAISEEKDESTLGLLRMAGIGPVSLLLGKSTTRLIAAGLVLAVQFPFTLLAITLGGITASQIVAAYAALFAYMIFVANLGLFCSVFASSSGRASAYSLMLVALYFIVPPLAASVAGEVAATSSNATIQQACQIVTAGAEWVTEATITSRLNAILTTGFSDPAIGAQVLSNVGAAMVLFLLSWALFEPFARDAGSGTEISRLIPISAPTRRKSRRAWRQAIVWKDFYFVTGGLWMTAAKLVVYGVLSAVVVNLMLFEGSSLADTGAAVMSIMVGLIALELAIYASRMFRDEVQNRTLSSLMMLPISPAGIGYSKVAGVLLGLFPALFYVLVGAALAPEVFLTVVWDGFIAQAYGWYAVLLYLVFLHLTALLSLFVKWGALPLALGIMYMLQSCFMPFVMLAMLGAQMPGGSYFALIPMALCTGAIMIAIQVFIHERLKRLAEQ